MLTRLELLRSAVLLESTEESRLEIIVDLPLLGFVSFHPERIDLDLTLLTRLESTEEIRLEIIFGPSDSSQVCQVAVWLFAIEEMLLVVLGGWSRTTGLAWTNVTASCL